ncbi:MAG: hypothetical protein K2Q34_03765 [Alphaproteobacteria bacterium]|nr:hypothetical protein [Alphaproteobacteria bacterium]
MAILIVFPAPGLHPSFTVDFLNKKTAPYEANRILRLLLKMSDLASQWNIIEKSLPSPSKKIRLFRFSFNFTRK